MSFESFDVLCLGVGLLVGFVTGWFSYRGRQIANRQLAEARSQATRLFFRAGTSDGSTLR